MDNDELLKAKGKVEFEEMTANQNMIAEFNKLGSTNNVIIDILAVIAPCFLFLLATFYFTIDPELFQVLLVVFISSSAIQGMVTAESKKTNRRIDLLVKILKHERERKNT